jgi:O-antigen/teichoic acid export membrane protein
MTSVEANDAPERPELDSSELREAAVGGIRWFALARIATEALQLVSAVALARLVSPADFGNASVALIIIPLAAILTYEGFGSALVQRKLIGTRHFEAATMTSLVFGVVLTLAVYFLARPIAAPIFSDEIAYLIQLAAPAFALAGLGAVSRAKLSRELDFRPISIIETAALGLGAFAAIGLAALGLGAKALVIGGVVGIGFSSLAMVVASPPGRPRWRLKELSEVTRFGAPASGAGVLYVAISNVDYAVLAARLNPAQVGIYWRAFQIGVLYQDKISGIMMRLAFPIYSRTTNLDEMKKLHERATRIHGAVVVPLLAILIVTAPELIPLVFGDAWQAAVAPAQVLAVAGMIAAILTGYPQVMLAAGRPRPLLVFNCVVLVGYGLAVYLTAQQGLVTVALAVVAVHVAILAAVYLVLFRHVLGMPIGRLVTDLAPAVAAAALVIIVGLPLADLMRHIDAGAIPTIVVAGAAGACVQAFSLRAFFPEVWDDVTRILRRLAPNYPGESSTASQALTP